ncbi:MAG: hypothetical protein CSB48_13255 [Proteobacteria bacterium]|nr:MAG: hypothetical protein CSB48_13255 [Pseudomonadota bacterium]
MSYKLFLLPAPSFVASDDVSDLNLQLDEGEIFDWCLYSHSGERLASGSQDSRNEINRIIAQNDLKDIQVVGLVPAQAVLSTVVSIPAKQQKYLSQALPFVVEEQLAQDIEDVHIVTARSGKKDRIPVVIIEQGIMARLMSCFGSFGFPLQGIFPDAALLPEAISENREYGNSVLIDGDYASFKCVSHFIKVRKNTLSLYLEHLFSDPEFSGRKENNRAVKLYVNSARQESEAITIASIEQVAETVSIEPCSLATIEFLAESFFHAPFLKFNLCQGQYRVQHDSNSLWKKWKSVVVVLVIWLVLQVGLNIGKGIYHSREATELKAQSLALYQSIFPDEKRVTTGNVSRFLKSKLLQSGKIGNNGGFLASLSLVGQEFSKANTKKDMELKSLNYNAQRGELSVELQVGSLQQLDALKTAISNQGSEVKIGSAVKEKGFVRGRLTISER